MCYCLVKGLKTLCGYRWQAVLQLATQFTCVISSTSLLHKRNCVFVEVREKLARTLNDSNTLVEFTT